MSYRTWWTAVATNSRYAGWFWHDIVPHKASSACRRDVASTLWLRAVPENWTPVKNIGGWPWPSGGYYTQQLWLHAVPDNWDLGPGSFPVTERLARQVVSLPMCPELGEDQVRRVAEAVRAAEVSEPAAQALSAP